MLQKSLKKIEIIYPGIKLKNHFFFIFILFFVNFIANFVKPYSELFDSALFKLQLIYPAVGLQPYTDFVFIYPFGPSLISFLITKLTHGLLNPINIVWPIHFFLQLILVKKILQNKLIAFSKIPFLYFILILETLVYSKFGGEPFSLILTFISLIELYKSYKKEKVYFPTFLYPTLLVFFKWDRLFFCTCVFSLFFILCKFKKINHTFSNLIKILFIAATSFSFLLVSLYVFNPDNFFNTINYIFIDPFIIAKYRSLPFVFGRPLFSIYNLYYFLIFIYILFFAYLFRAKIDSKQIFFYCVGLSLIPPTFGRSDVGHFIPFYFSSFFLIYSLPSSTEKYFNKNSDVILVSLKSLTIAILFCFLYYEFSAPRLKDTCSRFHFESNAKSIFVGNAQYDNFFVNFPFLYLNYIHLKPATKFITDEPGLQNTCLIQDQIIEDINLAPKPTIFFINTSLILDKYNRNTYKSCRKIEEYIAVNSELIGQCRLSDYNLDVRVSR